MLIHHLARLNKGKDEQGARSDDDLSNTFEEESQSSISSFDSEENTV